MLGPPAVQQTKKVAEPEQSKKSRLSGYLYVGVISLKKILECINIDYLIDLILDDIADRGILQSSYARLGRLSVLNTKQIKIKGYH